MKHTLRVAMGAAVLAAPIACQPTDHPRCEEVVTARLIASAEHVSIDCTPPFTAPGVIGWADHDTQTVYVWADKIGTDPALAKVLLHELGHFGWERQGRAGTQAAEERWADGFAWCTSPQPGVSYLVKPADCSDYTR